LSSRLRRPSLGRHRGPPRLARAGARAEHPAVRGIPREPASDQGLSPGMPPIKMLTTDEKIAEIRRLYFAATRETIGQGLDRALDRLKSMHTEEERERASVFMEGLNEMRSDWTRAPRKRRKKRRR